MPQNIAPYSYPLSVAIIGGGFCGTVAAMHLLRNKEAGMRIYLVNKGQPLTRGVAYNPHTDNLLLNVPNGRMSAFPDDPGNYVRWLMSKSSTQVEEIVASQFSTRRKYGDYLSELWKIAIGGNDNIYVVDRYANNMQADGDLLHITFQDHPSIAVNAAILATGNAKPGVPKGIAGDFLKSKVYFGNPWSAHCVSGIAKSEDILIIGAGLTAVDTIVGLRQRGFQGTIHTISPNGYCLNPCKEDRLPYTGFHFENTFAGHPTLLDLLNVLNRHRKLAYRTDASFYSAIDSLRPRIQEIWCNFSEHDRRLFLTRLKVYWEKVRHRLPNVQHEVIESMLRSGKLIAHKGNIAEIMEDSGRALVTLNLSGDRAFLKVGRVINCISPEVNISKQANLLLDNLVLNEMIAPGPFDLGIEADPETNLAVAPKCAQNVYVLGGNLKGVLWESTAVPELREQAKRVAEAVMEMHLLKNSISS